MRLTRSLTIKSIVLLVITMLMSSYMVVPAAAAEVPDTVPKKNITKPVRYHVALLYDSSDEIITSYAKMIPPFMREAHIDVDSIGVESTLYLEYAMDNEQADAIIYLFNSNLAGLVINNKVLLWESISEKLGAKSTQDHILGMGNAEELHKHIGDVDFIHTDKGDTIDLRLTVLFSVTALTEILLDADEPENVYRGERLRNEVMHDFCDNVNELFSKGLFPDTYTGERVVRPLTDPRLTESWAEEIPQYDENGEKLETIMKMGSLAQEEDDSYLPLREMSEESSVPGPIGWVLDILMDVFFDEGFNDLMIHEDAATTIIRKVMNVVNESKSGLADWFDEKNVTITGYDYNLSALLPSELFEFWSLGDSLIESAYYEINSWFLQYFNSIVNTPVQTKLRGLIPVFMMRLGTPINLGSNFASFGFVIRLKFLPSIELDRTLFEKFMNDAVYNTANLTESTDVNGTEYAFTQVQKFIDVIPIMEMDAAICAFMPQKSNWLSGMINALPFELSFFGAARLVLAFPPVDASGSDRAFVEVREWGLRFELDISYTLSILDFIAPGAGVVLSTILEWVESLLQATVTFTLSVEFEMSKKFVGQGLPQESSFLLDIIVGATLSIRLLIAVFKGTFSVGLRFEQKEGPVANPYTGIAAAAAAATGAGYTQQKTLAEDPEPVDKVLPADGVTYSSYLGIFLTLYCSLYLGIDLWFISFGTNLGGPWTETFTLAEDQGTPEYGESAVDLTDTDRDGLPDAYEDRISSQYMAEMALAADPDTTIRALLDPTSADTDSDGLNDKLEIELKTWPNDADSDNDGLTDGEEHLTYFTDPLLPDTEHDNLTDYEEVKIYSTNPFEIDSDGDGLHDWYEINHVYDVSNTYGTFGAVESVKIGNDYYNDRTDPLNPDTDNDGLLDGAEDINGVMYQNSSQVASNYLVHARYTSPLDADTDDDSLRWEESSGIFIVSGSEYFLWDMNDGIEVKGQYATIPDIDGYPVVQKVKTNPCNPDTDNDSSPGLAHFDGYELSLLPQRDPANGDMDNDGILDGWEVIGPEIWSSGTDAFKFDTDNDNLPDYEDWVLPTDQRDPDSDDDGVLDGDEYYLYGTDPLRNDTDFDGLTDSEELFFFYCNPNVRDSDYDGLSDGEEVLMYNTDPLLQDTDWDMLEDGYEVLYSHTDPVDFDTDDDRLGDGEELLIWKSNPLDWDTDDDSLNYPNATHAISLPWGDGDEVERGTNPTLMDSDGDGLLDGQEVYLAMGAPSFDPIPLDPLNNDTDFDGLMDGEEMILKNVSIITYPFVALTIELRYGSCPVKNDTDNDGLLDGLEIFYMCDPADHDTDDDSISDYIELFGTGTNPLSNDTDGDEIPDNLELWNGTVSGNASTAWWPTIPTTVTPPTTTSPFSLASSGFVMAQYDEWPFFPTDAKDGDSDDDLLPDGLEYVYGTNPLDPDENRNGILDGLEYDADNDGLSDGEEFYIYETWACPLVIENGTLAMELGGFINPDSDGDGIDDGVEVLTYGSDPTSTDSDGDGISDGDEAAIGGNLIVPITEGGPTWMMLAIGLGGGFIAGIFVMTVLPWTFRKFRGKPKKKATKKKATKKATKPKKKTTTSKKKSTTKSKKEGGKK